MKKILALLFVLFSMQTIFAQVLEPVKWTGTVEKISDTEYNLIFNAEIENHWHLYSQNLPEGGAIPTEFIYDENAVSKDFELVGKATESASTTKFDKVFEMDMTYFDYEATFTQKIKILNPDLTSIEAEVSYQACDDAKCIFESKTVDFQIKSNKKESNILDPVKWTSSIYSLGNDEYEIAYTAVLDNKWHIYSQDNKDPMGPIPTEITFKNDNKDFKLIGGLKESKSIEKFEKAFDMDVKYFSNEAVFTQKIKVLNTDLKTIEAEAYFQACDDEKCLAPTFFDLKTSLTDATPKSASDNEVALDIDSSSDSESKGLWGIFFIAFLSGFAALLTPCVFPMIPMTVSFFTKQSKSKAAGIKNAIIYGLCIIVIYLLLGTAVTGIFGADALNALATNVWFNIIFFILLVVFAFSFLGAFEIMLPNSWANKVDSQANRGGMVGIFFMALALAIVSFSCTGPIVGTLLVEAASKGGLAPIIGMLGFSSAIALPFALFAAFPGWLNSLPKSGGWLNTVKVVLGFLELALAFKFLSQADLVLQMHLLEREVFIAIWIAIFGTLALYLFGKIQLPHDSPLKHISVGRLSLGLIVLTFTIYMIPGLWGAPLNLISAFPPPLDYSESPYGVGNSKGGGSASADHSDLPEGAHLLAPHDILAFNDYDLGLAYAKKVNKPIMIDFTGWACVNCRKMEQNVWPKPEILNALKNDVVLISLYVDDKRPLEKDEIVDSKLREGKQLKYIGQKWSEFQTIKYKSNTQPYYVLMDHDEENLMEPVAFTPDADEYFNWLKTGIQNFK
ncbi:protein-disulfide reductase DsbD family protein [Lacinutrix algicola]|uniref:protein-disulfide reductase DsbD family protein n=1 Tax=Lacinutrix algicola TaxID=342954 RepID=UPI0009FB722F|nr:protein-disulfide reductase DsbD domain-containing protein [Lacinutrix algicola]